MKETRALLDKAGRIVIPASYRKALSIGPGEEVILQLQDGEIRLFTIEHAIARTQAMVKKYNKDNLVLSQELIKIRRQEGQNE